MMIFVYSKTFEESNSELQKLRVALHKANQQNRELAQANSRMLMVLFFVLLPPLISYFLSIRKKKGKILIFLLL